MKFIGILVLLAACRNEAITYAHMIDPNARCSALSTTWVISGRSADTAVCVSGSNVWNCVVKDEAAPSCVTISKALVEKAE